MVSASVPPGRSTRRISDRSSCTSRTCSIVSAQSTRSKLPSSNGSAASGSSSTMRASGSRRARALERDRRHVRGGQLRRVQLGREPAVAAAEVERALHVAERADEAPQRARAAGPGPPARAPRARRRSGSGSWRELKGSDPLIGLRAISMSVCPSTHLDRRGPDGDDPQRPLQDLPDPRVRGRRRRPLPARTHSTATSPYWFAALSMYVMGSRPRLHHAGARHRRAELRGPLARSGMATSSVHVLPADGGCSAQRCSARCCPAASRSTWPTRLPARQRVRCRAGKGLGDVRQQRRGDQRAARSRCTASSRGRSPAR